MERRNGWDCDRDSTVGLFLAESEAVDVPLIRSFDSAQGRLHGTAEAAVATWFVVASIMIDSKHVTSNLNG